eukprot:TRINITY_DN11659_c0_g1_i2.p1 TRINITY_DN11659_c0_g1~~TRINITY_DN11659_c0_g1_i2.p1  ORF type:complete len:325 (+),score=31.09 TRINITY_DN11659_c0_g1_i2:947-1921(+)
MDKIPTAAAAAKEDVHDLVRSSASQRASTEAPNIDTSSDNAIPADAEDNDEYEVRYVVANFDTLVNGPLEPKVFKMIGANTAQPYLQINDLCFRASHTSALGTHMLFKVHPKEGTEQVSLEYFDTTLDTIDCERVVVSDKASHRLQKPRKPIPQEVAVAKQKKPAGKRGRTRKPPPSAGPRAHTEGAHDVRTDPATQPSRTVMGPTEPAEENHTAETGESAPKRKRGRPRKDDPRSIARAAAKAAALAELKSGVQPRPRRSRTSATATHEAESPADPMNDSSDDSAVRQRPSRQSKPAKGQLQEAEIDDAPHPDEYLPPKPVTS